MSDLERALRAVGETGPERPLVCMENVAEWSDYAVSLESLALRLAVRLERAEKSCPVCDARMRRLCGKGSASPEEVSTCHLYEGHEGPCDFSTWCWVTGTGKEQGR